ncbi:MAG: SDR family NAD(P)-dependent oxidoreductase, partial [bacterium]
MHKNRISFDGKTAIVTGSTRGIGRSIGDLLGDLGCEVIYTGTGIDAKIKKGRYLQLDLSQDNSIEGFVGEIKKLGKLDILVNNAGINVIQPIDEITDD